MALNVITFSVIFFPVLVLVGLFLLSGVCVLEQNKAMVVERFGRHHRTLTTGLNFIIPFLDKVKQLEEFRRVAEEKEGAEEGTAKSFITETYSVRKIDLRERSLVTGRREINTKDNIFLSMNLILRFKVQFAERLVYKVVALGSAIENLAEAQLRRVVGALTLKEVLRSRNLVKEQLLPPVREAFEIWGLELIALELNELKPPENVSAAMLQELKTESERETTLLMAEAEKKARLMRAELFKEEAIKKAQAEAARLELINKQLTGKSKAVINYYVATHYLEAFKKISSGEKVKVVYLPYEATGILSALNSLKSFVEFKEQEKEAPAQEKNT